MALITEAHVGDALPPAVLTTILRTSPVGIIAARPLSGASGGATDFAVLLVNDAAGDRVALRAA